MEEIMKLAAELNKNTLVPHMYLRRNTIQYSFVSYINHTIALMLSNEYIATAIFINRANIELENLKKSNQGAGAYFTACEQYLTSLTEYLTNNKLLPDSHIEKLAGDRK